MTYLADTSMVVRLRHGHGLARRWVDAVQAGLVGVCPAELVRAVASTAVPARQLPGEARLGRWKSEGVIQSNGQVSL